MEVRMYKGKKKFSIVKFLLTLLLIKINLLIALDLVSQEHSNMVLKMYSEVTTIPENTLRNGLDMVTIPIRRAWDKVGQEMDDIF